MTKRKKLEMAAIREAKRQTQASGSSVVTPPAQAATVLKGVAQAVVSSNLVGTQGVEPALATFSLKTGNPNIPPPLQEVVILNNTPSVGTSDYTSSELYEVLRKKGRMGSESMLLKDLVMYVRNDLFPKLKFIMHSKQLTFSVSPDTICYQICADLGLTEMRASAWWELHKHKLLKTLNSKRADVTSAIKRAFMSKFDVRFDICIVIL
jgi:hypothetical protein